MTSDNVRPLRTARGAEHASSSDGVHRKSNRSDLEFAWPNHIGKRTHIRRDSQRAGSAGCAKSLGVERATEQGADVLARDGAAYDLIDPLATDVEERGDLVELHPAALGPKQGAVVPASSGREMKTAARRRARRDLGEHD